MNKDIVYNSNMKTIKLIKKTITPDPIVENILEKCGIDKYKVYKDDSSETIFYDILNKKNSEIELCKEIKKYINLEVNDESTSINSDIDENHIQIVLSDSNEYTINISKEIIIHIYLVLHFRDSVRQGDVSLCRQGGGGNITIDDDNNDNNRDATIYSLKTELELIKIELEETKKELDIQTSKNDVIMEINSGLCSYVKFKGINTVNVTAKVKKYISEGIHDSILLKEILSDIDGDEHSLIQEGLRKQRLIDNTDSDNDNLEEETKMYKLQHIIEDTKEKSSKLISKKSPTKPRLRPRQKSKSQSPRGSISQESGISYVLRKKVSNDKKYHWWILSKDAFDKLIEESKIPIEIYFSISQFLLSYETSNMCCIESNTFSETLIDKYNLYIKEDNTYLDETYFDGILKDKILYNIDYIVYKTCNVSEHSRKIIEKLLSQFGKIDVFVADTIIDAF